MSQLNGSRFPFIVADVRVKASSRTLWISLDMNNTGFEDDERLAFVPNKNQRHWKITLSDLEKINEYSDIIKACSKITY